MIDLTGQTLDDVAARALASILLERTADAINDAGAKAADAIFDLHRDTGLVLDVCAAILMATSSLTARSGIDAEEVFALALSLIPDEQETGPIEEAVLVDDGYDPVTTFPARPLPEMTPLPASETPIVCGLCTCPAVTLAAGEARCFYHIDHNGDDPDCPACHAWTPPEPPTDQPPLKRKAVKS